MVIDVVVIGTITAYLIILFVETVASVNVQHIQVI